MYLKTVKHFLRQFSSLEAGQLKFCSKKGQYLCMEKGKSHYKHKVFNTLRGGV